MIHNLVWFLVDQGLRMSIVLFKLFVVALYICKRSRERSCVVKILKLNTNQIKMETKLGIQDKQTYRLVFVDRNFLRNKIRWVQNLSRTVRSLWSWVRRPRWSRLHASCPRGRRRDWTTRAGGRRPPTREITQRPTGTASTVKITRPRPNRYPPGPSPKGLFLRPPSFKESAHLLFSTKALFYICKFSPWKAKTIQKRFRFEFASIRIQK